KRSFLDENILPELSIEAGIEYWKKLGFYDVEEDLLRKVCHQWGCNPHCIEMLAYQCGRRGAARDWGRRKGAPAKQDKNPHTRSLETLLESETLFADNLDEPSRQALLSIFSNRLDGETIRLLECLAVSPLSLPFDLLASQFEYTSYEELG